jgi:hypothetical protein
VNQQSIYATIKNNTDIGNSEANTLARVIWSDVVKYGKFWEKEGISAERKKWEKKNLVKSKGRLLTNEERSEELTRFLDGKLMDGSLTAAELAQFKDIYGLKAADRDISIELIDFKDALPKSYDLLKLAKKMIDLEIKEANEDSCNHS